jgi:hypothetical protein
MRCRSVACGMLSRMQSTIAIDYAKFYSRSHDAVIRVYDEAGNLIKTREQAASSKNRDSVFCRAVRAHPLF